MRIIPQLIAALKADADVTTALTNTRVYADYAPQDIDKPFILLSVPNTSAFGMVNNCSSRAYSARLTIDVICDTRAQTEDVIEAIENCLDGYSSLDSTHPIGGVSVQSGISWEVLAPLDGSDERAFVCTQDYLVDYVRT